jgi:DNA-binding transcriptional ArsR family regulator
MKKKNVEVFNLTNGPYEIKLEPDNLRQVVLALRAINHTDRQLILSLLTEAGEMTVKDLFIKLKVDQSIASQHLAILRRSNIVNFERRGKNIFYSVNQERLDKINEMLDNIVTA